LGILNVDNPIHIAALQRVFVPRIKRSLNEFAAAWNRHAISSEHGRTPLQLMLLHLPPSNVDADLFPAPVCNYNRNCLFHFYFLITAFYCLTGFGAGRE